MGFEISRDLSSFIEMFRGDRLETCRDLESF